MYLEVLKPRTLDLRTITGILTASTYCATGYPYRSARTARRILLEIAGFPFQMAVGCLGCRSRYYSSDISHKDSRGTQGRAGIAAVP